MKNLPALLLAMILTMTFFVGATATATAQVAAQQTQSAQEPQQVTVNAMRDAEWDSYRHAYTASAFFAAYTRTRPLIQAHLQIRPLDKGRNVEGLSLRLQGETTTMDIAVDAIGRATIPLIKAAYDEDAVLRLNREKGLYYFSGRYSIKERDDAIYPINELRAACEQLIDAQRESGYWIRLIGKKCSGIKFVYPLSAENIQITFKNKTGELQTLTAVDDHPFEDNSMGLYKVVRFRFADWPADGEIITTSKPIAIGTSYQ
jgi:hypothetical protein